MTIEVTGCHDCPFMKFDKRCSKLGGLSVLVEYMHKLVHPSCPLKQETITIKLKENDTTGVCKEGK